MDSICELAGEEKSGLTVATHTPVAQAEEPVEIARRARRLPRGPQVRLFLTLWLVYLMHWSPFVVRELYLTISLAERGTVHVDPYLDLHPDLFTMEGRGTYMGGNPGASFVAVVPYWIALPVIERVAPVRPLPPGAEADTGAAYDQKRANRQKFYERARELGLAVRLAAGALVTSGFFMAPLTALAAVGLMRLLWRMGFAAGAALWMALLFGVGTPIFLRAGTLSLNLLVALLTFWSFALLWRPEKEKVAAKNGGATALDDEETQRFRAGEFPDAPCAGKSTGEGDGGPRGGASALEEEETVEMRVGPPSRKDGEWLRYGAAGFLAGWAVLTDYTGAVTAAMLGLFALWLQWRKRLLRALGGSLWYLAGAVGPVALLLFYQWYCYGDAWLPAQFHQPQQIFAGYPSERGFGWPLPEALWGLIFHPQYGLLVFAPVFALALYHPVLMWKRRNLVPGHVAVFAWMFFAALYFFSSSIHYTVRHQWQDGVRYIVPALPLLFLLVADVLARAKRWLVLAVTAVSVALAWAVAMVRESPYESLRQVMTQGPQFPWLSTLKRAAEFFPAMADPGSIWAAWAGWIVLAVMLLGVWVIWAGAERVSPHA